ncbi:hypothetical protein K438DRAFT_1958637 [Mycena galopus ATCC 62051]|nr:hypothetical protein K438DRAFT_1958637 [Mycena galopus ATCC 62051]
MAALALIRHIVLSVVLGFSVIVLGLSAALTSTTETYGDTYVTFAALAIATAGLTLITLPIMIALEYTQSGGAFTSMVLIELVWFSILWLLWLATGADTAQEASDTFHFSCGDYLNDIVKGACNQTSAIQAFSFLNWIILLAYTILILVLSIIAHNRQHTGVWKSSVRDAPFFTPAAAPVNPTFQPADAAGVSYSLTQFNVGGYKYEAPHVVHSMSGSQSGETGPASV